MRVRLFDCYVANRSGDGEFAGVDSVGYGSILGDAFFSGRVSVDFSSVVLDSPPLTLALRLVVICHLCDVFHPVN